MQCFNDFVRSNFEQGRRFFIQIASDGSDAVEGGQGHQSHSMSFISDANVLALHRYRKLRRKICPPDMEI